MKIISFVVPSFNAAKFLDKCIPSLLVGGDDVEIIIVNDGSKDNTLEIANSYQKKHPNIIKVIDKENGGHGSTINAALKVATGLYFKCVDADDWVDEVDLPILIKRIKDDIQLNNTPDLYLTNFVFNNVETNQNYVKSMKKYFRVGYKTSWKEVKNFLDSDFLMMHMFFYKLSVLKQSKLELPLHTFYVDHLYVFVPLYYVHTVTYLDINVYHYLVGQSDQSVAFSQIDKKYDNQLRVFEIASNYFSLQQVKKLSIAHRKHFMKGYYTILNSTQYFTLMGDYKTKKPIYDKTIEKIKKQNPGFYRLAGRHFPYSVFKKFPTFLQREIVAFEYNLINKKTSWN